MHAVLRGAAAALLLAGAVAPVLSATLVGRQTNVFGNFVVGSGPVLDTGSFSELLGTLEPAYGQSADDAGAVNGEFNGNPVSGSASFASEAGYAFDADLVAGHGAVATTGQTPYSYVSLAANATSSVRLSFSLAQPTEVTISGSIVSLRGADIGTRTSSASASVSLNGLGSWTTSSHQGAFNATRTLLPGVYEIRADAGSRLNGQAAYDFNVMLSPVPEPARALLMAGGGLWLALRHRRARLAA